MAKTPHPTDKHVGSRVRMRRMMVGVSQEKLGDALGLTFQQVQKYEKGTNRIGASRLQQLANILNVPVSFFFEEGPESRTNSAVVLLQPGGADLVTQMLADRRGLDLVRAFLAIRTARGRNAVVDVAEQIAAIEPTLPQAVAS